MAPSCTVRWPDDAHLSGQQHVPLQHGAARQAGLRADDVVLAHRAGVAHLHQAVDLGAALHARFAHRGAIHRGEALHLHIVLDHGDAGLHDLEVGAVGALGETESVAAHHHAVLQDHAVADAAELAHRGVRMRQEIVADLGAFIDHHVRDAARRCGRCARARPPRRTGRWNSSPRSGRSARRRPAGECPARAVAADRKAPERARNPDKDFPIPGRRFHRLRAVRIPEWRWRACASLWARIWDSPET